MSTAVKIALPVGKRWEGCRLKAYKCPAGVWTIGYGHTKGVKAGMVWTQQQADEAFEAELGTYEKGVLNVCPSLKSYPNRLAACILLSYNIGLGAFRTSSVARYVNAKTWLNAANAFLLFKMAGGKVLQGLLNRRKEEREIFLRDGLE